MRKQPVDCTRVLYLENELLEMQQNDVRVVMVVCHVLPCYVHGRGEDLQTRTSECHVENLTDIEPLCIEDCELTKGNPNGKR